MVANVVAGSNGEPDLERLLDELAKKDFPKGKNIRRMLACLADLDQHDLAHLRVWQAAQVLRADRVSRIGCKGYFNEVLRHYASHPVARCRLWRNGEALKVESSFWRSKPLGAYLTYLASEEGLGVVPNKIEILENSRTITRYV